MKRLLLALLLSSCASPVTGLDQGTVGQPNYLYRADLGLEINGNRFDGLGAWKLTDAIKIKIYAPINLDRIQISSCARQDVIRDAKSPYEYDYHPSPTELAGACPLYIEAYDKRALTAWGMIAFRTDESMPAKTFFNAEGVKFAGFSIGQSKAGLEQTIAFDQPVIFEAEPGCKLTTTDKKNYTFSPAEGFCRATFAAKLNGVNYFHRLLFLAYRGVLVR